MSSNGCNPAGPCQSSNFRTGIRISRFLLPPAFQEWLPEGYPVYMMLEILEELDVPVIEPIFRNRKVASIRKSDSEREPS